jgi:general secretion pathway protein J
MRRAGPPRAAAGFTLIEVVVALALAGLVSLILLQGLRLTVAGFGRMTQAADRLDDRTSVEALLRHALAAAIPAPAIGGRAGFIGEPQALSFVTVADDGGAGLYRVDLAFANADGRSELVMTRRLAMPFAQPREQRSVLAGGVRLFSLAYFGAKSPADEPRWHDRWEGLVSPPQLVRITLEEGAAEARPPIVIRLWGSG